MTKDEFARFTHLEALPEVCLVAPRVEAAFAEHLPELSRLLRYRTTV